METGTDPYRPLRIICNVKREPLGHQYVDRYQQALDAVLAIAAPHDQRPFAITDGSAFGRGYQAGLRALAGAVIAAMQQQLLAPDEGGETPR